MEKVSAKNKLVEAGIFLLIIVAVISFFVGAAVYQYDPGQIFLYTATWLLFGLFGLSSIAFAVFGFAIVTNLFRWLLRLR
jgi:ABC-type phosphate transport system permease subunit